MSITQADLFRWSVINNATESEDTTSKAESLVAEEKIDPKWLDVILGKDSSIQMREYMDTITNENSTDEDKYIAFEGLQEVISFVKDLVEIADNANGVYDFILIFNLVNEFSTEDLKPLKMWAKLIKIFRSSPNPKLRFCAAWVIGSAVYNNPKSQLDYLSFDGLKISFLQLIEEKDNVEIQAKVLFAISGIIRHNVEAFKKFIEFGGFTLLTKLIFKQSQSYVDSISSMPSLDFDTRNQDPYCLQRRILFLLKSLLLVSNIESQLTLTSAEEEIAIIAAEEIFKHNTLTHVINIVFEGRISGVEAKSIWSSDILEGGISFAKTLLKFQRTHTEIVAISSLQKEKLFEYLKLFESEKKRDGYWDFSESYVFNENI
ncbi:hsp70 nucleotide exchange factor fes1 [Nowakowskiella sp. JEL0078]|nr:hsp70 nucleotide exchange factor fes1 [Nowakowskiella sp. JEL0078]